MVSNTNDPKYHARKMRWYLKNKGKVLEGARKRYTTPRYRFNVHKQGATARGIDFKLTFEEWWGIWHDSGHWEDRGKGREQYVMSRYGDMGGYEVGNVFIQTGSENSRDSAIRLREQRKAAKDLSNDEIEEILHD